MSKWQMLRQVIKADGDLAAGDALTKVMKAAETFERDYKIAAETIYDAIASAYIEEE